MPLIHSARAWLEVTRLSNLPTVLTNVLAGAAIVLASQDDPTIDWLSVALAMVAAALLYTAGMALNDAADAARDAKHRPERPIPSGRLSRRAVWIFGYTLFTLGVGSTAALGPAAWWTACAIATCCLLYTFLHANHAWACGFMALCRFGLYPLGALSMNFKGIQVSDSIPDAALIFAGALGGMTLLITLAARTEATAKPHTKRLLAWAVVFLPLGAPLLADPPAMRTTPALIAAVIFAVWMSRCARAAINGQPQVAIPGWLAGFCLFDAMVLAMHSRTDLAMVAAGLFILTVLAQRFLPGS